MKLTIQEETCTQILYTPSVVEERMVVVDKHKSSMERAQLGCGVEGQRSEVVVNRSHEMQDTTHRRV